MLRRSLYIFFGVLCFQWALIASEKPLLLLHFDLNKTIMASDAVGGKSSNDVIVHCLADTYKEKWGPEVGSPISYSDYVKEYLLPGSSSDLLLKKARDKKISGFLAFLEKNRPEVYKKALAEFEDALKALQDQKTLVFTSFYSLVEFLRTDGYDFSIIIRTFGPDFDQVAPEIENVAHIRFAEKARFQNGILYVDGNGSFSDIKEIYSFLKKTRNVAIQDDWARWFEHGERQEFGKPFPVDLKDKTTLSLFFDDNISTDEHSQKNIVNPIDVPTNQPLSVASLIKDHHIFSVDTIQAIKDKSYYVHLVKIALQQKGSVDER